MCRRVRCASVLAKAYFHYWFSSVFHRRKGAYKQPRRWGFSETQSQLNRWEFYLQRKRSEMPKIIKSVLNFSSSSSSHRQNYRCRHLPTFLQCDVGHLWRHSAQEGGVVWKLIFEVSHGHPVAMRLQLFNRAFAFEFRFWLCFGDIGVDDSFFGTRGQRELIIGDPVGLGLNQTVHSQIFVIFSAHRDFVAFCWD